MIEVTNSVVSQSSPANSFAEPGAGPWVASSRRAANVLLPCPGPPEHFHERARAEHQRLVDGG